jgi:hypothetical protein
MQTWICCAAQRFKIIGDAAIRRTIVDHDYAVMGHGGAKHAVETALQVIVCIVDRDDDVDCWG